MPALPADDERSVRMAAWFRKRKAARVCALVLPEGTTATASRLDELLRGWAGAPADGAWALPAGLTWSGPRATDPGEGEPAGGWAYEMGWDAPPAELRSTPTGDPLVSGVADAIDIASWVIDLVRGPDDPASGGLPSYARAAVRGLARRTGGLVREGDGAPVPPADPEATWSVYLPAPVTPVAVAAALAGVLPGLEGQGAGGAEDDGSLDAWVLSAPDGRGVWLEELDLSDAAPSRSGLEPSWLALAACHGAPPTHALRIEGADDTADAATRAVLDAAALAAAEALGGLPADAEGFRPDAR